MTQTTTFVQVIDNVRYNISVPEHRVESLINRVDMWIERNKSSKALDAITPFLQDSAAPTKVPTSSSSGGKSTKEQIVAAIEQNRSKGKYEVMSILSNELKLTKPQVYYYVRKAGL